MMKLREGDIIRPIKEKNKLMVVHHIANNKCGIHFLIYNGEYSTTKEVGSGSFTSISNDLTAFTGGAYERIGNINDVLDRWREGHES